MVGIQVAKYFARIDHGTAACEADMLPTELLRLVYFLYQDLNV